MKENNVQDASYIAAVEKEEESFVNFQLLQSILFQNLRWFILSLVICVGLAVLFVRYKSKVYTVEAKMLVKDDDSRSRRSGSMESMMMQVMQGGGVSNGLDNEIEVINSGNQCLQNLQCRTYCHR